MKKTLITVILWLIVMQVNAQVGAPTKYILKYHGTVSQYDNFRKLINMSAELRIVARLSDGSEKPVLTEALFDFSQNREYAFDIPLNAAVTRVEGYAYYIINHYENIYEEPGRELQCTADLQGIWTNLDPYNESGGPILTHYRPGCSPDQVPYFFSDIRIIPALMIKNVDRTDALQTVYCDDEVVRLKLDYHGGGGSNVAWQYRVGSTGLFQPLTTDNVKGEISFRLQDIFGANYMSYLNTRIEFRAAGANQFRNGNPMNQSGEGSNILAYSFSPSTAKPVEIKALDPRCGIGLSNALDITFNRALVTGEQLTSITLYKMENGVGVLHDQFQTPTGTLRTGNILSWTGVAGMSPGDYYVNVEGRYNGAVQCNRSNYSFTVSTPQTVGFTIADKQDVKCYGGNSGSITVTGTGGAGGYSYSKDDGVNWQSSNVFNGLPRGSYIIRVKDVNDCVSASSQNVTINQPAAALAAMVTSYADPLGATTNDGSVAITVSGGTTPYTYRWSTGATTQNLSGAGGGSYTVSITDKNNCTTTLTQQLIAPDPIVITFTATDASCNGTNDGSLQATVIGGVKPYTYNWPSTRKDNLYAGVYTFTVTDANGIIVSNSYTLQQPDQLYIGETVVPVNCYGGANGSISLAITGGTTPYTYRWGNGQTASSLNNLPAGIYSILVTDAHGCTMQNGIQVASPEMIVISGDVITPTRNGSTDGSITADISGGTAPYTYLWYNGNTTNTISDLGDGNYDLTITDSHGCTSSHTYNVSQPEVLKMDIIAKDVSCHGIPTGALEAAVKGGVKPYAYQWSNGASSSTITGLPIGSYTVKVTDKSGVITNGSYTIKEPLLLQLSLTASEVSCGGLQDGTVRSATNGGVTPYSYSWNTGASTADLNGLNGGMYTLHVTDANGCILSQSAVITAPGALSASAVVKDPVCYGKSDGAITLDVSGGRSPYTYEWSNGVTGKDLPAVPAGNYNLSLRDKTGCLITYQYTLTNPAQLQVDLGRDRTLCADQSLSLNAHIPDGASYSWNSSNGFTASTAAVTISDAGSYTLLATDNRGCTATDAINVVKDTRDIDARMLISTVCYAGESVIAVNVSKPAAEKVLWSLPAEATVVSQSDEMVEMLFKKGGQYDVLLTAYRGDCEETTKSDVTVMEQEQLPDVNTTSVLRQVALRPNPNSGQFYVDIESVEDVNVNYRFLDIQRNLVVFEQKGQLSKNTSVSVPFNIPGLSAGVYVLLVESPKEKKMLKVLIL